MRRIALAGLLVGCGRIGFDPLAIGSGGDDASGDAAPATGFSRLVAYADQTCAVHGGALYCWGRNDASQLGDETTTNRGEPTLVHVPAGVVRSLAQGESHGCAVVDAALYCWGKGFTPQPTAVTLPSAAQFVDAGRDFTCAGADQLYCWGDNGAGQLGDSTMTSRPTPMPALISAKVTAIDLGDDHACATTTAAEVLCWGHNDNGTLGTGSFNPQNQPTPTPVIATVTTLPRIAGWHACILQGGAASCWGRNTEGELGNGSNTDSATPVSVVGTSSVVATGGGPTDFDASCSAAGAEVLCWGAGKFGRLGNGDVVDQTSPVIVAGLPPGVDIHELAIGYDHACALLVDGDIWCWGRGDAGQLGNGMFANSLVPVRVTPL